MWRASRIAAARWLGLTRQATGTRARDSASVPPTNRCGAPWPGGRGRVARDPRAGSSALGAARLVAAGTWRRWCRRCIDPLGEDAPPDPTVAQKNFRTCASMRNRAVAGQVRDCGKPAVGRIPAAPTRPTGDGEAAARRRRKPLGGSACASRFGLGLGLVGAFRNEEGAQSYTYDPIDAGDEFARPFEIGDRGA